MAQPTLTAAHLFEVDPKLETVKALQGQWSAAASDEAIAAAKAALEKNTVAVSVVSTGAEALEAVKAKIPKGASVFSTASISLAEIGYIDYAKSATEFKNLNAVVLAETDPAKQQQLRREAALADIVVATPVAVSENGEILVADLTGTRLAPIVSGGQVVFVVGANKLVKNIDDAFKRLYDYVLPVESARVRLAYHMPNGASNASNVLVIRGGNPFGAPRIHVVIVKQSLGF